MYSSQFYLGIVFQPPKCDQVSNNIIFVPLRGYTNILSYLYRRRRRLYRRPVSKRPWCVQRPLNEKKKSEEKKCFQRTSYLLHMGPVHGGVARQAAATVTTTHFYWLYVRVFYTCMVFFIPFPSRTSYPLFSSYLSFPSGTRVCVFLSAHALGRIQRIPLRGKMKW